MSYPILFDCVYPPFRPLHLHLLLLLSRLNCYLFISFLVRMWLTQTSNYALSIVMTVCLCIRLCQSLPLYESLPACMYMCVYVCLSMYIYLSEHINDRSLRPTFFRDTKIRLPSPV